LKILLIFNQCFRNAKTDRVDQFVGVKVATLDHDVNLTMTNARKAEKRSAVQEANASISSAASAVSVHQTLAASTVKKF